MLTLVRGLAALLVAALTGGPLLLDGCLVRCHDSAARTAASAHCHTQPLTSGGLRLSSTSSCTHDHASVWADADVAARAIPHGLLAADLTQRVAAFAAAQSSSFSSPSPDLRLTISPPRLLGLRV